MRWSVLWFLAAVVCLNEPAFCRAPKGDASAGETRSAEPPSVPPWQIGTNESSVPPEQGVIEAGFGSVAGTVFGVSWSAGEIPLAGAAVLLFQLPDGPVIGSAVTDAAGQYLIDQVAAGEYGLYAAMDQFDPQAVGVIISAAAPTTQNFLLGPVAPCTHCVFQDVTAAAGLDGYVASTGDGHGPGAVFTDLNNDGYPEFYLVRATGGGDPAFGTNRLFVNVAGPGGTRRFVEAAGGAGAGDPGNATGAVAADYDNDGDVDLYVINFDQPNVLLQNEWAQTGSLSFVDVTASTDPTPGVTDEQFGVGIAFFEGVALDNSLTAAWADVDRDGYADLYVGNHNGFFGSAVEGPFNVPGRRDVFYHNNGDGTFSDVTMAAGVPGYVSADGVFHTAVQRFSSTNAVVFADFNNDAWPDLLVTNKIGGPPDRDMLYINQGRDGSGVWQGFVTVTYDLVPQFGAISGAAMGVDVGDPDRDGDLDIYITDFTLTVGSPGQNDLWINQLSETGNLSFIPSGALPAVFSWGTNWLDYNNDGYPDVHVATQGSFRDHLYVNSGTGVTEQGIALGVAQVRNARGDPAADYNRDGWVDLFVVNLDGGPSVLYQNNAAAFAANPNHFLVLKLVGDPPAEGPFHSTRDAIGARVRVSADLNGDGVVAPDETQMREVVSGHGNAASTSSLSLEFGLGSATAATVEVDWPSGRQDTLDVVADRFLMITEGAVGVVPTVTSWGIIVMALLTLCAGTIVFGGRRRALASMR